MNSAISAAQKAAVEHFIMKRGPASFRDLSELLCERPPAGEGSLTRNELKAAIDALARSGKVKVWPAECGHVGVESITKVETAGEQPAASKTE